MDENGKKAVMIAIGGHEEKSGEMRVLREFASKLKGRKVLVATIASEVADQMWDDYRTTFEQLGLEPVHLDIDRRIDGMEHPGLERLEGAHGIFFTGGDQLALTSKLGGTALCDRMHQLFSDGFVIAGTSAGASVLTETMLVAGDSNQSHRIKDIVQMAPGLGFIPGMVIDQHFAERGRLSRLLAMVAQNPRSLGIGIDENTAMVFEGECGRVVGAGAVYVVDGRPVTHTNVSEKGEDKTLSVFDVRLHVLSAGDMLDIPQRRPIPNEHPDHADS